MWDKPGWLNWFWQFLCAGFYPTTFLQPVDGSKNSILNWVLKLNFFKSLQVFFVCLSGKTLDRFFIILHHCFYFCKPQIRTKQTGLTIKFAIPQKNLCSCVQKIKNKHDGGADVAFFVSVCITHSLVERLSALIQTLAYEKQGCGTITHLMKLRGYRRVKSCMPPTK